MGQRVRRAAQRAGAVLLGGAILLGTALLRSPTQWITLGKDAALLAAGLQSPTQGFACFSEQCNARQATQEVGEAATQKTEEKPSSAAEQAAASPVIPPKGEGGGAVEELLLDSGETVLPGISVKNNSGQAFDYTALWEAGSPVAAVQTDEPQVLIVHTHTCESYMSYYAGYYNADDATRSTDDSENVVAVGEAIAKELQAAGIGVVHDTAKHDYPAFSGAYERSEQTILANLAAYPSIRVVLDIHRDAMMAEDQTKYKPTTTVAGRKAAQVMLVIGATDTEDLPNSYCAENIRFGLRLQNQLGAYEGLTRPIYLVDARYNQGLLPASLLIEVGTDANTLSEALYAGQLVGKGLSDVLNAQNE